MTGDYPDHHGLRSAMPGVAWPAIPGRGVAMLLSLLYQFEASQWWPAERLRAQQFAQLQHLLRHAYQTVPFYRARFDLAGFDLALPLDYERWASLPLLTRRDIQDAGAALNSNNVPKEHGRIGKTQTSGSTGQPVVVHTTELTGLLWRAFTLRHQLWHHLDFSAKIAIIRALDPGSADPPLGRVHPNWGAPTGALFDTGPSAMLTLRADVSDQAAWLAHHAPDYLLTYPSNLMALIADFERKGARPANLRLVQTIGENLTPAIVAACREVFGVPIIDMYTSQEVGYIALQCPQSGLYHLQGEGLLTEILDDQGRPCKPGEIGRVVLSSLHNFATPLLRYEIRDYAEVAAPCPCGRGLPALARIVGRERNMLRLPSGDKRWPLTGFKQYRDIAPIRQYQFVQKSLQQIEVRFVVDRPLTPGEEARLRELICNSLGHPFQIDFVYAPDLPRGPTGKFEEFISEAPA